MKVNKNIACRRVSQKCKSIELVGVEKHRWLHVLLLTFIHQRVLFAAKRSSRLDEVVLVDLDY